MHKRLPRCIVPQRPQPCRPSTNFALLILDTIKCVGFDVAPLMLGWLRQVLGDKVDQRGSLVVPEGLRFDFTCAKAMKADQIQKVQEIVQEMVDKKYAVFTKECNLAEARAICALRAVFGEKYPDPVRVVSIGQEIDAMIGAPDNEDWKAFSVSFNLSKLVEKLHLPVTRYSV